MLITKSFVFVHIPKTGGTFIQSVLAEHFPVVDAGPRDETWSHTPYSDLAAEWQHLPAFCLVRNPWDWYVSWFHYQLERGPRRRGRGDPWGKWAVWEGALRCGEATFDEAVRRACTGGFDHPLTPTMKREGIDLYTARVRGMVGDALERPNFTVLRYERGLREQVLRYLADHAEVTPALASALRRTAPLRVSAHGAYPGYYDDSLRDLVGEKASWLCERFGYRFRRPRRAGLLGDRGGSRRRVPAGGGVAGGEGR